MSLAKLDAKFKTIPRHLRFITDHIPLFSAEEHEALAKQIETLERRYVGLHVSLMTLELPPNTNLREYMFWLFNRCRFSPADAILAHNYSVVIVIDATGGTVFMSTGFGFEQWIQDEDLQAMLDAAIPQLSQHRLADGCKTILNKLTTKIEAICATPGHRTAGAANRPVRIEDL